MDLQIYWWIIISLLGGLLVFMLFVNGGQTIAVCEKNELYKDMMINSLGRKWELTFTTLVLFGGASFAAFPLFYSTSFGGAYWVWLAILLCFTIQAVSYEYRKKPNNFLGAKTYEAFLFINGSLGVFLIGAAVSTFFSGSAFVLDETNFVTWQTPWRGLEALLNPYNYVLGLALVFLSRLGGAMYLYNNINEPNLGEKLRLQILKNAAIFVPLFVVFLVWTLLLKGYGVNGGKVELVAYKYALNLIQMPLVAVILLVGVVGVLGGVYMAWRKNTKAVWVYGVGVVLAVMAVFLVAGLNDTAFYPSYAHLQSSLTIRNASSSPYTLKTMAYVSLAVPFVLGYIFYVWRAMDMDKITADEIKNSEHKY